MTEWACKNYERFVGAAIRLIKKLPMRQYLIATVDRRPGSSFKIQDESGKGIVGVMHLNGEKARHEMWLNEDELLKHAKALALVHRRVGFAVFLADIRTNWEEIHCGERPKAFSNMPFFALRKMANDRGVDISDCEGNEERARRINAALAPA